MPVGLERRQRLLDCIRSTGADQEGRVRLNALQVEAVDVLHQAHLDPIQRRSYLALISLFRTEAGRTSPPIAPGAEALSMTPLDGVVALPMLHTPELSENAQV